MAPLNTDLDMNIRSEIAHELSKLLASNYTLYLKTQNFHWNVKGPFFQSLHTMFEEQYNELAIANDDIAERILALGFPAPATYAEFAKLSFIKEPEANLKAVNMVAELIEGHQIMIKSIRAIIGKAGDQNDEATNDLLSPRLNAHEKTLWMLRTFLEE